MCVAGHKSESFRQITAVAYVAFAGVSALVLTDRHWAWRIVSVLVLYPSHLALLLEWSEARLPGISTVVEPLFRLLARLARRKGIDKELEERYCR